MIFGFYTEHLGHKWAGGHCSIFLHGKSKSQPQSAILGFKTWGLTPQDLGCTGPRTQDWTVLSWGMFWDSVSCRDNCTRAWDPLLLECSWGPSSRRCVSLHKQTAPPHPQRIFTLEWTSQMLHSRLFTQQVKNLSPRQHTAISVSRFFPISKLFSSRLTGNFIPFNS